MPCVFHFWECSSPKQRCASDSCSKRSLQNCLYVGGGPAITPRSKEQREGTNKEGATNTDQLSLQTAAGRSILISYRAALVTLPERWGDVFALGSQVSS